MQKLGFFALDDGVVKFHHAGESLLPQFCLRFGLGTKPIAQHVSVWKALGTDGNPLVGFQFCGDQTDMVHDPHFGGFFGAHCQQDETRDEANHQDRTEECGHQKSTAPHTCDVLAPDNLAPNVKRTIRCAHAFADSTD